ncbi:MAG TPA: hypothetical protein VLG72_01130, partial [Nitrospirota bacterium]|nr:hypothetical protein [Nitrospirota bacterium]
MTAIVRKQGRCLWWCGILMLCLAICFQLLGSTGTLFDFNDAEDAFQASVLVGYTITSSVSSWVPWLMSVVGLELTQLFFGHQILL